MNTQSDEIDATFPGCAIATAPTPTKTVAVIIPCYNEESYVARCLDSILSNDYDARYLDIVVVDGMSNDKTREIVTKYAQRYPHIRLLDNRKKNKPAALNLAINETDSEVVMRIDAHAIYEESYISKLVSGLDNFDADNIGGIRETDLGRSTWQGAVGIAISHPFAAGNAVYRTGVKSPSPRLVDTVFCGCYRREVFGEIGLFNPKLIRTQDREFNLRLTYNGGKIVLDPTVRCTYFPRTQLWDYTKWVLQGAFWVYYADRFTKTRMRSSRNWIPVIFVLWNTVAFVMALLTASYSAIAFGPIALYWLTSAYFSGRASIEHRSLLLFPFLVLLFAITHYGYGLGACAGVITARYRGTANADHNLPVFSRQQAA